MCEEELPALLSHGWEYLSFVSNILKRMGNFFTYMEDSS